MNEQEPVDVFALAAKPIGGVRCNTNELPHIFEPEAIEGAKRANKKWLPKGKRGVVKENQRALDDAMARQTDIEDAVERAGGQRGGAKP